MPEPVLPQWDVVEELKEAEYNALDILVTARVHEAMGSGGGLNPSLFDQALMGPSITCSLRGLRVDQGAVPRARQRIEKDVAKTQAELLQLVPSIKFGKSWKPSPKTLAEILYQGFKVRTRLSRTDSPTVAKDILAEIVEDPKTPDEAIPVCQLALKLSALEEDRKALEKPAGPDGRIHSSFMVSSAISGRWGSRRDSFGDGMNLHSASDFIREIFIPDPGCILVSMDQMQAESNMMAFLAGSEWYIEAHKSGNVHLEAGRVFFPDKAEGMTKAWAKATDYPGRPGKTYYDLSKSMQHGNNYGQSAQGLARQLHIPKRDAMAAQLRYFSRIPEIPAYHRWVKNEIVGKRRLVSPVGRVRQFLGRTWENSSLREAISWQPQSGVSDITKIFLWRLWKHLDPWWLQVLMEHHDSVLFQVRESQLDMVMEMLKELSRIPLPIGDRTLENRWETHIGPNWANMKDYP